MKRFDTINVIPFIDIMLVLLAIVLTTASFIATGKLDIAVPGAESTQPPPQDAAVEIAIDRDLVIFLNEQTIGLADLDQEISQLDHQQTVVFRVDETVPFLHFTAILDLLKKHGIARLSIVTRQKPGA